MSSVIDNVTEDLLELYGFLAIRSDGETRLQYYQAFAEIYSKSGFAQEKCGRIYNYAELAELAATVTVAAECPGNLEEMKHVPASKPFSHWHTEDWKSLREAFRQLRKSLIRQDANASMEEIDDGKEDHHVHPDRAQNKYFEERLWRLYKIILLHQCLAPFREALGQLITDENMDETKQFQLLEVPDKFLDEFLDAIEEVEDEDVKRAMSRLLTDDKEAFQSPHDLYRLFTDPKQVYSYTRLLAKTDELIRKWASLVFDYPELAEFYLRSNSGTDQSRRNAAVQKLKRARERLDEQVDDPMDRMAEAAAGAKRSRRSPSTQDVSGDEDNDDDEEHDPPKDTKGKRRSYEKKKSATRLEFTDDEVEDDDEEEILSRAKPPVRVRSPSGSPQGKQRKSQTKKYEGRRQWTEEEKNAIKEGIVQIGYGKWALIKEHFEPILNDRTSGQIKDCVRTMKKKGDLDAIPEAWPSRENVQDQG